MPKQPPLLPPTRDPGVPESEGDSSVATQQERKLKKPRLYKVLLHNDNYTTMEFVIMILMSVFNHDEATATRVMLHVHERGVGVAGTYAYDIAETKMHKTMEVARQYEFPLKCSIEPE